MKWKRSDDPGEWDTTDELCVELLKDPLTGFVEKPFFDPESGFPFPPTTLKLNS